MNKEELIYCPFCGSERVTLDWKQNTLGNKIFYVLCVACKAKGSAVSETDLVSAEEAANKAYVAWNTRVYKITGVKHDKIIFDELKESKG